MTKQRTEHRAGGSLALRPLPCSAHLTQHLGLTEDGGVEAGRNREEVVGDVVVEPDGAELAEPVDRAATDLRQELLDLGDTVVEPLDDGIDLRAQTGREEDGL